MVSLMKLVANMEDFRAAKLALIAKWGDKVMSGTDDETREILKDLAPAAKFARLPVHRLLRAVASMYANSLPAPLTSDERDHDQTQSLGLS